MTQLLVTALGIRDMSPVAFNRLGKVCNKYVKRIRNFCCVEYPFRAWRYDEKPHIPFQEEELKSAILAVLANKQDMEGAMTVAEVHSALGLDALKTRTFQIFKTSAIKGEGLDQAMDWLANALSTRKWNMVTV